MSSSLNGVSQIENYRGIAKLSAIPKIYEKNVKDKIYVLISQRISTHQHGFLAGKWKLLWKLKTLMIALKYSAI